MKEELDEFYLYFPTDNTDKKIKIVISRKFPLLLFFALMEIEWIFCYFKIKLKHILTINPTKFVANTSSFKMKKLNKTITIRTLYLGIFIIINVP